jgi:hypothetical protein
MFKICLPFILVSALFAQKPQEPSEQVPPEVDAALRARVKQFYQYEVEGKFRQAEPLVAEESKDLFVAMNKPTYKGFQIKRIEYFDRFTRANVVVMVDRLVFAPGFEGHPFPAAVPSHWKLEKGEWCWYVDPADLRSSPFGDRPPGTPMPMPGGTMPMPGGMPPVGGDTSRLPPMPNMSPRVRIDKSTLEIKPGTASTGQVTLFNPLRTPVTLSITDPHVPGLSVKLDQTQLKAGQKAVLLIQSSGPIQAPAQPVTITIRVQQTNQLIPIKVSFPK